MVPEQTPRIQIPFPSKGLSENYAFDEQEPGTTRDLLNVRAIDPKTQRTRGAQRSGMNRYLDDVLGVQGGANSKIQDMNAVVEPQTRVEYFTATGGALDWEVAPPHNQDVVDMKLDEFGNLYIVERYKGGAKYNQDGILLATFDVPDTSETAANCTAIEVDDRQNVVICTEDTTDSDAGKVYAFAYQQDGTYKKAWTLQPDATGHGNGATDAILTTEPDGTTSLYLISYGIPNGQSNFRVYPNIDFVVASIDPPTEDATKRVYLDIASASGPDNDGEMVRPRRMALSDAGYVVITGLDSQTPVVLTEVWVVNPNGLDPTAIVDQVSDAAGTGIGIVMGNRLTSPESDVGQQSFYTIGPPQSTLETNPVIRRWRIDSDGTISNAGSTMWQFIDGSDGDYNEPSPASVRMAVDGAGNLYVPAVTSRDTYNVLIFDDNPESGDEPLHLNHVVETQSGLSQTLFAVAVHPKRPFGFDAGDSGSGIEEYEYVYLAGNHTTGEYGCVGRYSMASVTQSVGTLRSQTAIALGGGVIEKFSSGGAFSDPANGTGVGVLDTNAPLVQSVVSVAHFDADDEAKGRFRVYITDGASYLKYDPEDDAVTQWRSATQGEIPPRCRLIALWQGRIVLARDPENPAAWHMSAIGDPENWDNFPQNISPAQAISGVNAAAGDSPDVVNSIIPWDDDLLIFGGDRTITRLDGNPLGGGQINLVTDQTGTAIGRPWCKEPGGGALYFMSNQCAVYAMNRGGGLVRLTRDRIERRLQDAINFSTHYIQLVWNYRDEGFHVFQLPYGAGGTLVNHWFWDRKNDAWFEDQFGTTSDTNKQPTAVLTLDGDAPTDRVLLIGCEDGRIRVWDQDSPNDDYDTATDRGAGGGDNLAIDSYVTIGPIQPRGHDLETQFTEMRVWLARDQDGVEYDIFLDDEPDFSLDLAPVAGGSLLPGHNPTELVRFTGDSCYLRLRNASALQRWAFERATIAYAPAGMKRV